MLPRRMPLLAVVILSSCGPTMSEPSKPPTATPTVEFRVVPTERQSLIRQVEQPGSVRAYEETPVFGKVSGFVARVLVDIGDHVQGPTFAPDGAITEPGTLLAAIRVPEMIEEAKHKHAQVRLAEVEIELARRRLQRAEAHVKTAAATVSEAQAGLQRANSHHDRWESQAQRIAGLTGSGVLNVQVGDETQNQFQAARSARDEARAHVLTAEALALESEAERDEARVALDAAEARCEICRAEAGRLDALVGYLELRAPFDGVITRRMVDTGHFIPPGTPQPLFIVAQEDRVRVVVEVPEADAPLIRTGLTATVVIPSLKTKAFEGPLARTAWSLEPGSRTLRVEIDLDNAELRLRPGMYVTARIAAPRPEAFVVPTGALTRLSEQTVCYRAVDGQAVRTPVAVGFSDGQRTEMIRWQASDGTWHDWSAEVAVVTPAAAVVEGQKVP